MPDLRRVRPGIGGSGTFRGPMGGHFSYPVAGNAEYFLPSIVTDEWQDMHNPIYTRRILDYQKNRQLLLAQDQTEESPPTPIRYYRVRTRT